MATKFLPIAFILPLALASMAIGGTVNLPQTGQTNCYDTSGNIIDCAGTGQDGMYPAGVAWPNPRFTLVYCDANGPCTIQDSDCDGNSSSDVIVDNLTGLMWTRNAKWPYQVWQGALNYVATLNNQGGLCGHRDWRLPNVLEQESLINDGEIYSSTWLKYQNFIEVQSTYWTSTSIPWSTQAFQVYISNGEVVDIYKSHTGYIWPVRLRID